MQHPAALSHSARGFPGAATGGPCGKEKGRCLIPKTEPAGLFPFSSCAHSMKALCAARLFQLQSPQGTEASLCGKASLPPHTSQWSLTSKWKRSATNLKSFIVVCTALSRSWSNAEVIQGSMSCRQKTGKETCPGRSRQKEIYAPDAPQHTFILLVSLSCKLYIETCLTAATLDTHEHFRVWGTR